MLTYDAGLLFIHVGLVANTPVATVGVGAQSRVVTLILVTTTLIHVCRQGNSLTNTAMLLLIKYTKIYA